MQNFPSDANKNPVHKRQLEFNFHNNFCLIEKNAEVTWEKKCKTFHQINIKYVNIVIGMSSAEEG